MDEFDKLCHLFEMLSLFHLGSRSVEIILGNLLQCLTFVGPPDRVIIHSIHAFIGYYSGGLPTPAWVKIPHLRLL